LDHTKGELLLTIEKLKKFEKSTEKLDEILRSQISPNDKTGLGYNDILKTKKQEKCWHRGRPRVQRYNNAPTQP
jgi:hypothetical protein